MVSKQTSSIIVDQNRESPSRIGGVHPLSPKDFLYKHKNMPLLGKTNDIICI